MYEESGLNLKYGNLSSCTNIKSATTLLATHNLENGFIHNKFFQQMAPKLPNDIKANYWLMPHQQHLEWFSHWLVPHHMHNQMCNLGYSHERAEASPEAFIKHAYKTDASLYFTPKEFSQQIFGDTSSIVKDPVYLDMILSEASILADVSEVDLNEEKASAIVAIAKTAMSMQERDELISFVMANTPESVAFTEIVNKAHDANEYLYHTTSPIKSDSVKAPFLKYQQTVFLNSREYLSNINPTETDQKKLTEALKQAKTDLVHSIKLGDNSDNQQAKHLIWRVLDFITGFVSVITNELIRRKLDVEIKKDTTETIESTIDAKGKLNTLSDALPRSSKAQSYESYFNVRHETKKDDDNDLLPSKLEDQSLRTKQITLKEQLNAMKNGSIQVKQVENPEETSVSDDTIKVNGPQHK